MPETVIDEPSSEIAGRAGDRPIYESLGDLSRNANLSESWHSVHRVGFDDLRLATPPRGKADMGCMADLARAGHFLMLRF
jgi:hypothetical protein